MQRNCLEFEFEFISGRHLIVNRNKLDWETLNTPKIKTVFYSHRRKKVNDYGTKLRIKCHQRIQRKEKTIDGELCTKWDRIDSFGVKLDFDDSKHQTDGYEKYYNDPGVFWDDDAWLKKHAQVNHRSLYGENGFILKNETYERFEPIGITWHDSYCRRITDAGPSGCFVERDFSASAYFDSQKNNCTGKDSTNLFK